MNRKPLSESAIKSYPNILQSIGIAGILLVGFQFLIPVHFMLNKFIGFEVSRLISYIIAVGIPFGIVCIILKKKTGAISFNISIENKRVIPFVIVGTIFLYCGIVSPISALIPMSESTKETLMISGSMPGIYWLIQTVIAAPILEELIFSGVILNGLLKRYSPKKSILITSFLFGLIHLDPWQFVTVFLMGVFSGWVYYKTKSLSLPIIIHATYNIASILMRIFIAPNLLGDNIILEMYRGTANLIFTVLGSLIIISICILFLIREFNKKETEMAKLINL